jgi:hypothetical protein
VTGWLVAAIAAVLLFWVVGAYNRVVRLRTALVASFEPVEARHRERQELLERQMALVEAGIAAAAPRVEALRAAARQASRRATTPGVGRGPPGRSRACVSPTRSWSMPGPACRCRACRRRSCRPSMPA